ncbi:hypothetical protein [Mesorhizobium sp.]|uniref:hypothetical protein n=1 Tax=Mesorhizobium sp. TaxID=1871066 RepID=UPI000FE79CA2|nr:hypothetical protein [Mesorhizobium sp.]RWD31160.1 MAG: hypothetical protein EOS33_14660 [Mesorhizobium sp.]
MAKRTRERERIEQLEARLNMTRGRSFQTAPLNRDEHAFLDAFNITLSIIPDPAERYAYSLTGDGAALVERVFQTTTTAETRDRIAPTDTPEIAQAKWREWIE